MDDLSAWAHVGAAIAAGGAGFVNAIAGGGTLISFPALMALGVPGVNANATNTVSLMPGYFGGVVAQRDDLATVGGGTRGLLAVGIAGGALGSVLLVISSDDVFRMLVPFLILLSTALLAFQNKLRAWIFGSGVAHGEHRLAQQVAVGLAAVYGGYFGAGLGIMLIAVLGLFSARPLNELNAVKLVLAFVINLSAAVLLTFSDKVEWSLVMVMAPAALIGGHLGGRVASKIAPAALRAAVVTIGLIVAVVYFVRLLT